MDHGTYDEHQDYCQEVSAEEPEFLHRLRRATNLRCIHPRMASGPYLGRILSLLSRLIAPDSILEIGTYTGYGTLCLAEGLSPDGRILTIEKNDELKSIQDEFFAESPFRSQIENRAGNGLEILSELHEKFQLIFLDADKENYHLYLPAILNCCEQGSIILIDNMLWEGKVMFDQFKDEQTDSIRLLTKMIKEDPRLEQILLPIRDGIMVIRVIAD